MNDYKIITLKNGLRIILVPNNSTEVMTSIIMFRVGSRNESEQNAGISHVLEHMCFKGTEKRPTAQELAEFVDSFGAEHNAFTGKEITAYYVKARPKNMEKAFDYLSDMVINSLFREEDLNREKNVIIQEINMYQDLPMQMVGENFEKAIFGQNALGREIIGYKSTVKSTSSDNLMDYRNSYYQAANGVLVLAGNFGGKSEEKIIKLAEGYFSLSNKNHLVASPITIKRDKILNAQVKKTEQSHIILGFLTVPHRHPDFFKLEVLAALLGGSMSSRMFSEVREKRGLAYSVRTHTTSYIEAGAIFTQAGVEHDKVEEAFSAITEVYNKIKEGEVSEEELSKAKEVISGHFLIKLEDSEELACHYATDLLLAEEILTPKQIIEKYQSVTKQELLEVAKKYLTTDKICASFVGPIIDEDKIIKIISKT